MPIHPRPGANFNADFQGANGVANVLNDRELVSALFRWVEKNAKMGSGDRGTIDVVVHGGKRTVGFQWYDSFGISRQNHRGIWRQDGTHRRRADESRSSQEAATRTQASARTQPRQVRYARIRGASV